MGCLLPALARCDRQQCILKYVATGSIVCPDALTILLLWSEGETWSRSQSALVSVHVYGCEPVQRAALDSEFFFSKLPLIPDICELMNSSMSRVGFLSTLAGVKVI